MAGGVSGLKAILFGLLATVLACLAFVGLSAVSAVLAIGRDGGCGVEQRSSLRGVPKQLVPIFERAAAEYELGPGGPAVLAAINFTETTWGTNLGPSDAGAVGWMQFLPSTWAQYGVDANGDGVADPNNPEDAIHAAAKYLRASGAPTDWYKAIFAYNHLDSYVQSVLGLAEEYNRSKIGDLAEDVGHCMEMLVPQGPALQRLLVEAVRINALQLTYLYGGSHGTVRAPANGPFDCSSAVSRLLQVAGYDLPTMTTAGLINWGEPGPGRVVTIRVKAYGPSAHTFLEFSPQVTPPQMRYWGTSTTNPGGGPGWIPESALSAGYLSGFEKRHPPGL